MRPLIALAGIVALVILPGCSRPVSDPADMAKCGQAPSQQMAEGYVKTAVSQMNLLDPESARITNINIDGPRKWPIIGPSLYGWQVSFFLNAKNTFGGYVGAKKHLVLIKADGSWHLKEADAWNP